MKSITATNLFESCGDYFDSYVEEMVAVINLKGDVFEMATDLPLKETFFAKIQLASRLPEIRVLLILSGDSVFGEESLARFLKTARESSGGKLKLVREENALSQFIRLMCGYDKIALSGVRGSVIGAFLGAILSVDHRVASENTLFTFPIVEDESSPQGALAFFLRQYVGTIKAKKILLSGESLPADKACELGLVDDVIAESGFEGKCFEIAKRLAQIPPGVVSMTKRLMKCDLKDLDAYLKMEADYERKGPNAMSSDYNRK